MENRAEYRKAKQTAKCVVAIAKKQKSHEFAEELNSDQGRKNVFRIARQMTRERQDIVSVKCVKNAKGEVMKDQDTIREIWKQYMEKLLNEENEWDSNVECNVKEGPSCTIGRDEVVKALKQMRDGKAPGLSGVASELMKAAGDVGIEWLTDLCDKIIQERKIPEDWKKSVIVPVYKGKGSPLECGSYRAIKLLEHAMKVLERVLANRIREQVDIDDMQFGFTPGKGTTDAIFIL